MTREELTELFVECFNECSVEDKIDIHNTYERDNGDLDNVIYNNTEDFFDEMFENADSAVRAVCYGTYTYNDDYVWFDGYGNLESGTHVSNLPLNDPEIMGEWFIDHCDDIDHIWDMSEFIDACNGVDDEEGENNGEE